MTKVEAIRYLRSSGFSIEQIYEIIKAFKEHSCITLKSLWLKKRGRFYDERTCELITVEKMEANKDCEVKTIQPFFDTNTLTYGIAVNFKKRKGKL